MCLLKKIDHRQMGSSNHGWLKSLFHFSFAEYQNPDNIHFGVLRVINDDLIDPNSGFGMHPHRDMEIISYVVEGELTHADNMGNQATISRGHVQYMSAGTGVYHSEHNLGKETLRLLQIWIFPDKKGRTPQYGENLFLWEERQNQWLHMVSGSNGTAPIKIHQDINIYSIEIEEDKEVLFSVQNNRQAYMVQIEGESIVQDVDLFAQDAMEIIEEEVLIRAKTKAHILMIEMKKFHS